MNKETLSQAAEPVGYLYKWACGHTSLRHEYWNGLWPSTAIPLYTHPAAAMPDAETAELVERLNTPYQPPADHPPTNLDALDASKPLQTCVRR